MRARRRTIAAVLGTAAALAACGGDGRVDVSALVLDPAGRIYDHSEAPRVRYVDPHGDATWLHAMGCNATLEPSWRPLAGGVLEVFAQGCRVERIPAPRGGRIVVRLRRGIPVRIAVRWDGTLPEGVTRFGVHLESEPVPHSPQRPPPEILRSVAATWIDEDRPAPPRWTPVEGRDPVVDLCVPEPGRYRVEWDFDAANRGFHEQERIPVEIRETGQPATFTYDFPRRAADVMAAQIAKERGAR